jgi:hypothetical protein
MITDIVLSLVGIVSVVYLLSLIRGSFAREKEKVDEFLNPWGPDNQPIWVAGNLRQRHTPELVLPRPFIPSNTSKLPINPHETQSDCPLPMEPPHQIPYYQYKQPNQGPLINPGVHFDQLKELSGLPTVPEHSQGSNPMAMPQTVPADILKPITPVGGIRGTPPIRLLPVNISSLETLYPPPPPAPPPQPDPITAPRGGGGTAISPNLHQRRKSLKQPSTALLDTPQLSSSSSSSCCSTTSPKHPQHSARSFTDSSSSSLLVSIDMKDLTLQHVLGGGAFGQVWQAMWKSTPVAVKVLSSSCGNHSNEEELRAFNDEVQMLAHLRHPNICLFLGASLKPPNRFIVTELISRGSLWDALRKPNIFNVSRPPLTPCSYSLTSDSGTVSGL